MRKLVTLMSIAMLVAFSSFDRKPKEVEIPCKQEGLSDSQYFRASGSAKSKDMASAKDKSLLVAKQTLASLISSTIESVSSSYSSSISGNSNSFKEAFETLTRETVNQQLKNVSIICQKVNKSKEGYEVFTAVEMSKVKLVDAITTNAQENDNLKTNFDEQKFREIFEAEMKKIQAE
ncbi:MAG: hypothetical protein WHT29_07990 [Bacteroidales bacterium]